MRKPYGAFQEVTRYRRVGAVHQQVERTDGSRTETRTQLVSDCSESKSGWYHVNYLRPCFRPAGRRSRDLRHAIAKPSELLPDGVSVRLDTLTDFLSVLPAVRTDYDPDRFVRCCER